MALYGLKVKDSSGNYGFVVPDMASIISSGTVTMPNTLQSDNTYGVDIDLPGVAAINNSDIGVIVQARDFDWKSKLNVATVNPSAEGFTASLYARNTTHKVNAYTGYIASETQGSSAVSMLAQTSAGFSMWAHVDTYVTIDVLHSNGSKTNLGSAVANKQLITINSTAQGQYAVNWSCPATTIVETDALLFTWYVKVAGGGWPSTSPTQTVTTGNYFVTGQLGWTKLKNVTWSISRYMYAHDDWNNCGRCYGRMYWGSSATEVKITNLQYEKMIDQDYWGQFFAEPGQAYYKKNETTGVMTAWTPGAMTASSQTTWDPVLNVSVLAGWDKSGTTCTAVRLFAAIAYGVYDASVSAPAVVYTIGDKGISEVDYIIYLKNYDGS